MPNGYTGQILHIDLSNRNITIEKPPAEFYRRYLGGSALNLYYLLREIPARADPLCPENVLGLSVGVTTGTAISGNSRVTVSAKSPLTGAIGDSQAGGFWPATLKWAGFDGIIIKGRASSPVYLWIHDGKAELKDASHLWGKITGEAETLIKSELGDPKVQILQIGPAGEQMVRYACLISMCSRAAGRTGMGAVMGSKNLKAVVAEGNRKPQLADKQSFKKLAQWGAKTYPESGLEPMGKYGTAITVGYQQGVGGLPTHNFSSGVFDGWEKIDGPALYKTLLKGREKGKQESQGEIPVSGVSYAANGWWSRRKVLINWIHSTEVLNTNLFVPWAPTVGWTIWQRYVKPMKFATSTAWIPFPAAPPSPGPWKPLKPGN